jgi:hypothetical protein
MDKKRLYSIQPYRVGPKKANFLSVNLEQTKECAGKGCNNNAIKCLEINFLHKHGWFCNSCSKELMLNGLAREKTVDNAGDYGLSGISNK